MSLAILSHVKPSSVVDVVVTVKLVGVAGFVYALTPAVATESPPDVFELHIINEYWVAIPSPVIAFVVAFAAAVVVVPELQLAGAVAPAW